MKNLELKNRAESLVKDQQWDRLLCLAFLELRKIEITFGECIAEIADLELTNISRKTHSIKTVVRATETTFLSAIHKSIKFEIGGYSETSSTLDHLHSWQKITVSLVIEHKTALTLTYSKNDQWGFQPEHFSLWEAEEVHVSQKISDLLQSLEGLILRRKEIIKKREAESFDKLYDDRFSLLDTEVQKDTVLYKLGRVFGKIFKN